MDSQKLLHEQQMVAEAAAVGFCRPPREKRMYCFGRSSQTGHDGVRGIDYKKFIDEQQAIEQAEAAGFCILRAPSKSARSEPPRWDLGARNRAGSLEGRRMTSKEIWNGSGDAPNAEFSTVTSRVSTQSRCRIDEEKESEDESSCQTCVRTSDESLIQRNSFKTKSLQFEPLEPQATERTVHSSTPQGTYPGPSPARVMVKKQPSFPELPHDKKREGISPTVKITIFAWLYGMILFGICEILFQMHGRKHQTPRRAKFSLLRMVIDDIMYFGMRRFCDPNHIQDE